VIDFDPNPLASASAAIFSRAAADARPSYAPESWRVPSSVNAASREEAVDGVSPGLRITGRIKEQYKLENGKYVMPSPLEEELKMCPYISNVMLYGDAKPFNVALVVVNEPAVRDWAAGKEIVLPEDPTTDERVRALIGEEMARLAGEFKGYEKPRDFALVREDFTIDNGLLTPTMKLRRRDVLTRYGAMIEQLYARQRNAAA